MEAIGEKVTWALRSGCAYALRTDPASALQIVSSMPCVQTPVHTYKLHLCQAYSHISALRSYFACALRDDRACALRTVPDSALRIVLYLACV
jgi:hypothetical protein